MMTKVERRGEEYLCRNGENNKMSYTDIIDIYFEENNNEVNVTRLIR